MSQAGCLGAGRGRSRPHGRLCARLRCLLAFLPVAVLEQEPQRCSVPAARVVDALLALLLWRRLKFRGHLTARPRPRGLLWPHWGREELSLCFLTHSLPYRAPAFRLLCLAVGAPPRADSGRER